MVDTEQQTKKGYTLDVCVSSLRSGHANLFCLVPMFSSETVFYAAHCSILAPRTDCSTTASRCWIGESTLNIHLYHIHTSCLQTSVHNLCSHETKTWLKPLTAFPFACHLNLYPLLPSSTAQLRCHFVPFIPTLYQNPRGDSNSQSPAP